MVGIEKVFKVLIIEFVLTVDAVTGTESLSPGHVRSSITERDTVLKIIEDMMAGLRAEIEAKICEEIEADYRRQTKQYRAQ